MRVTALKTRLSKKNTGTVVVTSCSRAGKLHPISGVEAMQQDTAYLWRMALENAIAEEDPQLARTKIETAEVEIFHRIHDFASDPKTLEVQALFDALGLIRGLKARLAVRVPPHRRKTLSPVGSKR